MGETLNVRTAGRRLLGSPDVLLILAGIFATFIALIIPIHPWMIDILIVVNIALAMLMLMTTVYLLNPLELSSFPSILLVLTFYRLALNVATTRLILGSTSSATDKAGKMVQAFGEIVAGRDVIVGGVIFLILVIIQFVVITKGATRISEVAARFSLDAMPGKQMAVDADLNAGLIDEEEARARRIEIMREADFYGAMDGASKWVRGDAIAALIITLINIIGGMAIGVLRQGLSVGQAMATYTTLTIGDGLVSQVPALTIAIAAGLIITRTRTDQNLGQEVVEQIFTRWRAVATAAAILALLGVFVFAKGPALVLAAALAVLARHLIRSEGRDRAQAMERELADQRRAEAVPERVDSLLRVDPMEIEIGYGLIPLVDVNQGGELLGRITQIRRQIAVDLGVVVPPIRVRDNMQLRPNEYRIKIKGVRVASGEAIADGHLAMDSGAVTEEISGTETREPAFGLPAVWISAAQADRARAAGYTVVDSTTVIATHLTEVIRAHAPEILTREEVTRLLENMKQSVPNLVEDIYPKQLSSGEIQRVLQGLLSEGVSVRDLETVLEVLGENASRTRDTEILTEYARNALARWISRHHASEDGKLHVVTMDPGLEEEVRAATQRTEAGSVVNLSPGRIGEIQRGIEREVERLVTAGHAAIVLCSPTVRVQVHRIVQPRIPGCVVLSYNEVVPEVGVESVGMIRAERAA